MPKNLFRSIGALLLCLVLLAPMVLAAEEAPAAESGLAQLFDRFREEKGLNEENFAVSFRNTVTGEEYAYNDTKMLIAASTFKLPANLYYYKQELEGKLDPNKQVGAAATMKDLHRETLLNSSNDYTMLLLYKLEFGDFTTYKNAMLDTFFTQTREEVDPLYYQDNYYCTRMMLDTLQFLYDNSEDYQEALGYLLDACPDAYFKHKITDCPIAHKYGSMDGAENDVGIIYAEQPFLLAVYTYLAPYGETVCADAAKLVKDYVDGRIEAERLAAEKAAREEEAARPKPLAIEYVDKEPAVLPEVEEAVPAVQPEPASQQPVTVTVAQSDSASLGIIGGADGPTAIFLTGSPVSLILTAGAALLVLVLLILLLRALLRRGHYQKKNKRKTGNDEDCHG